jgi:hypothetical protein
MSTPPYLRGRGPFLYLVSALLPERWQGRMDYTVDAVPTLGAYKAADTRLFLQEYRIVLPARASAVDAFRCSRESGVLGLAASSRSCRNKGCVNATIHRSSGVRECLIRPGGGER